MSKVYIMHGFIGSGKTSFAKRLEEETGAKRFTPDKVIAERYGTDLSMQEIRESNLKVKAEIWNDVKSLIKSNQDIILDYGLWKKEQRVSLINEVKQLGAEPIMYEIICDKSLMKTRALKRNSSGNNQISEELYDTYFQRFEPMSEDEERVTIDSNSNINNGGI